MHTINLRHVTFKQALIHAKTVAGMTNEDISEASGISGAQVARYFQEHDPYAPSPHHIPGLCRALKNTILVEWLNAQVADLQNVPHINSATELTLAVMKASENTGVLSCKAASALADGHLAPSEARILQAQFRANGNENFKAADALEPLAKASLVSGR